MQNVTGVPVTGDDFFGREKELQYAWDRIKSGNNLILPSPRRVGKTSFALKLLDIAKENDWQIISINLERLTSEHQFIEALIDELKSLSWWEKAKDKGNGLLNILRQAKPSITHGDVKIEVNWEQSKPDVYKQLAELLDHSEKTLIFLDELTILLASIINSGENGKRDVTNFLHWLRDIRIIKGSKIKWIYCSSVGIDNFTHQHGISDTRNDIPDYRLKSYKKEVSIAMLRQLNESQGTALTEAVFEAIVDKLEYCLPYFLQIMFEKIHYLSEIDEIPINTDIVHIAWNNLIGENHFNTWIERLDIQYGNEAKHAFAILKHLCQTKEGDSRDNLTNVLVASGLSADEVDGVLSRLLYMLQNDGYLIEENKLYHFRSPLLRDFWYNRFIK